VQIGRELFQKESLIYCIQPSPQPFPERNTGYGHFRQLPESLLGQSGLPEPVDVIICSFLRLEPHKFHVLSSLAYA
jgi:hypothetical protein